MALRIETVSIDARDPVALARFWSAALGWEPGADEDGDVWVEPAERQPGTVRARPLLFVRRVRGQVGQEPDPPRPPARRSGHRRWSAWRRSGPRRSSIGQTGLEDWVVLADPEGNEFCVLSEQ